MKSSYFLLACLICMQAPLIHAQEQSLKNTVSVQNPEFITCKAKGSDGSKNIFATAGSFVVSDGKITLYERKTKAVITVLDSAGQECLIEPYYLP